MQLILAVAALSLGLVLNSGASSPELQAGGVSTATTTLSIPTYPYAAFLETRHSDLYNMDYPWLNWSAYEGSGPLPVSRDYTALVVENAWLRLTFLPELGGRLYGVTDKITGEELLYQNPVVKPTHWGPLEQGWWLAVGGIEWCLPVDEHGYEWGQPWDYSVSTTAEGTTVTLWDTLANDRVRARIAVYLPADRAAFQIVPRLENPTAFPVSFKFWDNAMLAPGAANTVGPEMRFVLPIDQVTVHSRGDNYLPGPGQAMAWPLYGGTDYSRLGNWNQWLGFFARPQAARDWAGIYDDATGRGVARVFPREVAVGVKGFAFGWNQPIDWHVWTDDGSTYVELHGGPSPTFWDQITLGPGEALEWTETWLPFRDLPVLSQANAELALGLEPAGSDLDLGLLLAEPHDDVSLRLWRQDDCTLLWREDGLSLSPAAAYSTQLPGLGSEQVVFGVVAGDDPGLPRVLALTGDLDCPPPSAWVDPLDTVQTSTTFPVSWSADDPGGMLLGYDVQVREGDASASWSDWLTCTAAASAPFEGQDGQTYTFRARGCDLMGRVEEWGVDGWLDTFTTVLLQPAPVLITSYKSAEPDHAQPGQVVRFEIWLENSGNLAATVHVTDSLPAHLELAAGPWISPSLDPPVFVGDTLTWSGSLGTGQPGITITFDVRLLDLAPVAGVTNVVWIDDGAHNPFSRQATVRSWRYLYVPLVIKEIS